MKGQMYITITVLIIVALFALKMGTASFDGNINPDMNKIYMNIKDEIKDTLEISLLNNEDVSANLDDFLDFTESSLEKRGYTQDITYEISGNSIKINLYLEHDGNFINDTFIVSGEIYP